MTTQFTFETSRPTISRHSCDAFGRNREHCRSCFVFVPAVLSSDASLRAEGSDLKALQSTLDWTTTLMLATFWSLDKTRDLAISKLDKLAQDAVTRLELSLLYYIPEWRRPAICDLMTNKDPLTVAETKRIGPRLAIRIAGTREKLVPFRKAQLDALIPYSAAQKNYGGFTCPFCKTLIIIYWLKSPADKPSRQFVRYELHRAFFAKGDGKDDMEYDDSEAGHTLNGAGKGSVIGTQPAKRGVLTVTPAQPTYYSSSCCCCSDCCCCCCC